MSTLVGIILFIFVLVVMYQYVIPMALLVLAIWLIYDGIRGLRK